MNRQDSSGKGKPSGRGSNNTRKGSSARGNAPFKKENTNKQAGRQNNVESKPVVKKAPQKNTATGVRLNKYISNSGVCSRREADTYIATGLVTVNGKIINEMGYKVALTDDVRFDGRRLNPEPNTYVLLNKPKGFSTTDSESKGHTVMDLVANSTTAKIKPFGRLGRNSTGLLLFTNDEQFRQKFTKKGMDRLFHIVLDKNLKGEDLKKIREGFKIDDKLISVEEVSYITNAPKKEVGLKIKHTGNSVIRTIFDHLGYDVAAIDCVTIGALTKKDLPRGRWRHLTQQDIDMFGRL
ncbi:pseudouridine synthase [Ulvibacter litoralis]|uniref:23S rRNA pseudouridine2605 synthase n=1 Tax=Ulvibacter litoralis TaxID=227084 RepID=A0A1G7CIL1_9FLAO|nr:pseudouridine synthase [Ulvibacter litoralis]GHC47213.1 pseudouridylate synthase [Ulvibacter litoralis]SDE39198.1 23S rRNA pseudouridine2605 synthase [Ulvibacter litoralis]